MKGFSKSVRIVVSDAGPLIALAKTDQLFILKEMFSTVLIPQAVYDELRVTSAKSGALALSNAIESEKWLKIKKCDPTSVRLFHHSLGKGEVEAISLAKSELLPLLIDETRGRKVANSENVRIFGTGAVLVIAKRRGIITKVKPLMILLRKTGYRISDRLYVSILEQSKEQ